MHRLLLLAGLLLAGVPLRAAAQWQGQSADQLLNAEKTDYERALTWAQSINFPSYLQLTNGSAAGLIRLEQDHPVFFTTHNKLAGTQTHTIDLHSGFATGTSLTGSGMVIGLWDESTAFDSHQELTLKIDAGDLNGPSNHSTHVAGTLVAAGIRDEARGMAPEATIRSYNWNFHTSEMRVEAESGMLLSNHSYGRIAGWHKMSLSPGEENWFWFGDPAVSEVEDYAFGYYDRDAFLFDHIAYANPNYLPVVSAGNERDDFGPEAGPYMALDTDSRWVEYDATTRPITSDGGLHGYDTMTSIAVAKNALTVGALGYRGTGDSLGLSVFSSAGPSDDGRIKPDILGLGENLISPVASGVTDYAAYSGTSMATPNVSGSLLLLQQLALQLRNAPLRAATLKGLAIHTATDLGPAGPDYLHGWGLLNTSRAAKLIKDAFQNPGRMIESRLETGETFTEPLALNYAGPIRITLCWTDPPPGQFDTQGADRLNNRTPLLVNDLDLTLTHMATGQEYKPYVLSAVSPNEPATRQVNNVDPVEQIHVDDALPGNYTLQISHKGTLLYNQQPFSLLLSGIESKRRLVQLDSAFAQAEIGRVMIEWQTISESVAGYFTIERATLSDPLISASQTVTYTSVSQIPAAGSGTRGSSYTYEDEVFLTGNYQYRILFVDAENASRSLVKELNVDLPAPEHFSIHAFYPNPVSTEALLALDIPELTQVTYTVFDLLGRSVFDPETTTLHAGRNFINVDVSSLAPGIYFMALNTASNGLIRKFVVLR